MNVKENQQYQQTHRRIMDAMLELLGRKTLKRITVAELCRAAGINRSTFYEHFPDTGGVMESMERGLSGQLRRDLPREEAWGPQDVLLPFFRHVRDYRRFYALYLEQGLALSVWSDLAPWLGSWAGDCRMTTEYALAYRLAGMEALVSRWLKRDCRETPEELYDIWEELARGGDGSGRGGKVSPNIDKTFWA